MSAGSSSIDPVEFNELQAQENNNNNSDQNMPNQAEEVNGWPRSRRHFRGTQVTPYRYEYLPVPVPTMNAQPRIWIFWPNNRRMPGRSSMNRIVFAVARSLRAQRSVRGVPGIRPTVMYHREGDLTTIDLVRS